ncbi:MAG: DUF805 domain-containing protein [Selenomonas bovis]|nr:DUF805 domain-containing protein [Selenomonas bovis]
MAKFCGSCGAPVDDSMKFCSKCGAPVAHEEGQGQSAPNVSSEAMKADLERAQQEIGQVAQQVGAAASQFAGQAQRAFQEFQEANAGNAVAGDFPAPRAMDFFSAGDKIAWYRANILHAHGRINRLRYLTCGMLNFLLSFIAWLISGILGGIICALISEGLGLFVIVGGGVVLSLPIMVASYTLAIRRLHDFGMTGWLVLACFVPYINILVLLALFFAPGTLGPNRYGQDPIAGRH